MLDVTWHINAGQELYSASKVLDGLSALRRKGQLSLQFARNTVCPTIAGKMVVLTVRTTSPARSRKVIIDLGDSSNFKSPLALEYADIYFKRCLMRGSLESLAIGLQARVQAFGLNFACVAAASWSDWLAASVARAQAAVASGNDSVLSGFVSDLRVFAGTPSHKYFVTDPRSRKHSIALYQTRVWPPEKPTDNFDGLNQERVDLVMILREALGSQFVGGVVDTEYSRARFPRAVVDTATHRRAYAALTRSALIGVYTRGIDSSLAFKLSEYLAAGCCMVVEPFEHILDIPLEPGVHYLPFSSSSNCVAACKQLFEDPPFAAEMSRRNAEYFAQHMSPETHMARVLSTAMSDS